jgi:hypothetical protein
MERFVLKEQLKEVIGSKKITAALFYTFNFDPYFFENYVMPLLLPDKTFRDEAIYNNILWRRCAKEGLIPPVTVYCDHYAKDNTMAPTLGYEIRCIRLPGTKDSIVNFHPKECWLLLEDSRLIQLNGSANLTHSGWCENLECCNITVLEKNSWPKTSYINYRQRVIQSIAKLSAEGLLSKAEQTIFEFLRYTDETSVYFSNQAGSFFDKILELTAIYRPQLIEIIAPYMNGEAIIINHLRQAGIKQINCLIPSLKTNEVLLSKDTFIAMLNKGVAWCNWSNNEIAGEARNLHAKIYRLYSASKTITITGSVNFTSPAWGWFTANISNRANVESGIIHIEEPQHSWLRPVDFDPEVMTFLPKEDLNTTESTGRAGRNAPQLNFTIDWKKRVLSYTGKLLKSQKVRFKDLMLQKELHLSKDSCQLSDIDIRHLSKNALIELIEVSEPDQVYAYYPCQLEIESRPLNFKLNPSTILNFWLFGEDTYLEDELTSRVAETVTDESGIIDDDRFFNPSLLNEMALHFTALISLEKQLFDTNYPSPLERFQAINYYLLTENLETVPFYLKGLMDMAEKKEVTKSFLWMILEIICIRFYDRALSSAYKPGSTAAWRLFITGITERKAFLQKSAANCLLNVEGLREKSAWLIEQIRYDHG